VFWSPVKGSQNVKILKFVASFFGLASIPPAESSNLDPSLRTESNFTNCYRWEPIIEYRSWRAPTAWTRFF